MESHMPSFLSGMHKTLKDDEGVGCNTIKKHLAVHIVVAIGNMAIPTGFDTESTESNHKHNTKRPAVNTQCRAENFEFQTSTHCIENLLVDMSCNSFVMQETCDVS